MKADSTKPASKERSQTIFINLGVPPEYKLISSRASFENLNFSEGGNKIYEFSKRILAIDYFLKYHNVKLKS